jgi:hypothetical protein
MLQAVANEYAYRNALKGAAEHEQLDLCESMASYEFPPEAFEESPQFNVARLKAESEPIVGHGVVLKQVRGMGTVYDWRKSPWTPANGGKINPLIFVQHIPVVPNMAGIADFVRLRDVLVAQGLMVQNATDREGNVALFTPMNILCYQAKGANQQSCGTEHMHLTLNEPWTRHQLRASAWLVNQARDKYNLPTIIGTLDDGPGVVRVFKRGQVSHMRVSQAAGYNDRTDPGLGYDWEYVHHCVAYYRDHQHFEGA